MNHERVSRTITCKIRRRLSRGLRLLAIRMATRPAREEERGEKRSTRSRWVGSGCKGKGWEEVASVQSHGLAWKGKGESKSTLIYGNPLGLELGNSDRLALIAAFPLPPPPPPFFRVYFYRSRRMASDEISRLPLARTTFDACCHSNCWNALKSASIFSQKLSLCRRSSHDSTRALIASFAVLAAMRFSTQRTFRFIHDFREI